MWRWTALTFTLAIINTSAQLDSNETDTLRECCPCPPRESGLARAPGPVAPGLLTPGSCGGLPGLDHCPCLRRDADSEGSASILFPDTVRSSGNAERPKIKEEAKPLLHPEVDLASSMLETLREATEEEYRNAVEREGARAATPVKDTVSLTDAFPVETRNVVTIIVSPEDMSSADDSMSQASHAHDTRCIHGPLGNSRLSNYHQPQVSHKGLDDILNLPLPGGLIHKQRDNNLAASNVHESVVKVDNRMNKFLSGFKLRSPDFLNVPPVNNAEDSNDNNDFNDGRNSKKSCRDMKERKELLNSASAESFDSDPELVNNSKAENENDIDIVDIDDGNDAMHSKNNEGPEYISSEYLDILNNNIENLRLDQENNERIINSHKEINNFPSSKEDLSEINGTKERNDKVLVEGHPKKILDIIRKKVIEKLDTVLIENARDFISQNVKEKFAEEHDTDDEAISLVRQVNNSKEDPATESTCLTSVITDEIPDLSASIEEVSYKDLQNMSNSLLHESEKNIALKENQTQTNHNLKSGAKFKEENFDSSELSESEIGKVINEAGKLTNIGKKENSEENSILNILKKPSNTKINELIVPNTIDKANCDHDLEPLASEPVINSKIRPNSKSLMDHLSDFESRLRQNIIVQPTPAAVLNFPDISDFNTNIPTLEEIRSEVSEILGGLARHTFGEEVSNDSSLDSDDFASNINPVISTGSLTSDSTLSPRQPFKDIDLNIIQLKPLPLIPRVDPLITEVPGLNLNTYKAKLAIPNSMDIRPLNLASTLSNGGGLVGAKLSIRPENYSNVGNIKSTLSSPEPIVLNKLADIISNVKNNARQPLIIPKAIKGPHLTASNNVKDFTDNLKYYRKSSVKPIFKDLNYPSFDDIRTNIKANSDNLLSSSSNAIETLQNGAAISNVVDSLKSQTENTMRHLQETFDSPMISDLSTNARRNKINVTPSLATGNKLLSNNLNVPKTSNFADDLRSQVDSALRNMLETSSTTNLPEIIISKDQKFQKALKAKLRQSQIKNLLPVTDPKDVLQIISNHREDFHDKLVAVHTDLRDRLESMHNDAINPETLKTILSPPNNRYFESFYIPLPSRRTSIPNAKKLARPVLKTKQPSLGAQRNEFRKSTVSQTSKPKSGTSKLSTMRTSTGNQRNSPKLSKLESAGTAPTIARIDRPALPKIYSKPKLSKPLDRQLLKNPLFPQPGLQGAKKLLLRKDNHLTGFNQSTIRPNSTAPIATTKKNTPFGRHKVSNNNRFTPKPFVRQQTPWSAWEGPKLGDSQTSPSTAIPKLQTPLKSKSVNKTIKTAPLLPNVGSLSSRIQPQSLLKTQPTPQGRVSYPEMKLLNRPKNINSSLLSKLSAALKSRQSKANLSSSPGESSPRLAMAPAASERVDQVVALDEPMKENVSYKCKMMCVRTD